ncbi:MAG: AAA family ATPase [Patescibacteria group bacterium]
MAAKLKLPKDTNNKTSNGKGKRGLKFKFQFNLRNLLLFLLVLFFLGPMFFSAIGNRYGETVPLPTVLQEIKDGKIENINVSGDRLVVKYKDGAQKTAVKEGGHSFTEVLRDSEIDPATVPYKVDDQILSRFWLDILGILLPLGLMAVFFLFIFRQARGAQDNIFSFGKSGAKAFAKGKQSVTFADVAGVDEAKRELEEVVDFLKNPAKYRAIGARTPKGVLLFGPSGVGKTLLARGVAGEAGVPFFSMAGSEFMEMLVGVGASVTGDTPILIKSDQGTKLLPIGQFVDSFFKEDKEGLVRVGNIRTLGFDNKTDGFWGYKNGRMLRIANSAFKSVTAVFRHKVQEIYEIHYLGGVVKTTADHSVFIRRNGRILPVATKDIKKGDILVELPLNIRLAYQPGAPQKHKIIAHKFTNEMPELELDVWNDDQGLIEKYQFALANSGTMSQYAVASQVGVSQATVGNWQSGLHMPRLLSKKLVKLNLPDKIAVTPALMKLLGFYTAEGRGIPYLEFIFGIHETSLHKEVISLMHEVFGVYPVLEKTQDNTLRIKYHSAHLGRFFIKHCGSGSHNKHVPELIWGLPKEYFLSFLEGYWQGDGYQAKSGKFFATSVSKQLILELSWLCSMYGMKVGIKHEKVKGGRIIKNRPLPDYECWTLIIGKTTNPFLEQKEATPFQFKRAIVQKIVKKSHEGYVYDLCGVENEAFFGGEKPILLHNSRVRDLFLTAKKAAPSIIFIDEIDAIGRQRGHGIAGGHDEREQTLNQILVEMDGFTPNDSVLVIAATNRGDLLDPALLRPGRFDRRVTLDLPDKEGREAILKIHARGKKFVEGVDWARVSSRTVGFSGADLENMLNEAAIAAARDDKKEITVIDINEAATKVKLGPARRRLQSEEDKRITAYHEAGHAIVSHVLPSIDPIDRISIVARNETLGQTSISPEVDRVHETKTRILELLRTILGGRAAEELVFSEMTIGASNDIAKATELARRMVSEFGMSGLGPINWQPYYDIDMVGRLRSMDAQQIGQKTQDQVDREIRKIIAKAYKEAQDIVKRERKALDKVVEALLVKETLDRDEFEKIVGAKKSSKRPAKK